MDTNTFAQRYHLKRDTVAEYCKARKIRARKKDGEWVIAARDAERWQRRRKAAKKGRRR